MVHQRCKISFRILLKDGLLYKAVKICYRQGKSTGYQKKKNQGIFPSRINFENSLMIIKLFNLSLQPHLVPGKRHLLIIGALRAFLS